MESRSPFCRQPDVPSQLQAELENLREENARLQEAVQRWQTVVENEPECVKVVAEDGTLLEMNPAGLAMLEAASLAEVKSRPLIEFIAPEYREAFTELHRRVMRGERCTLQFAVVGLRGGQRWLETYAVPHADHQGRPVALVAVTRDITRRRRAETALSRAEARLRLALSAGDAGGAANESATATDPAERKRAADVLPDTNLWFRLLAENIRDVFWIIEPNGKLLYVSPGFGLIWGRPGERIDRHPLSWLRTVHPDDHERVRCALELRQPTGDFKEEYRIVRPDGAIRWVRERSFPVRDHAGRIHRVVAITEDITEGKQLEERFLQAQRREAIGTLAAGVAHDLNNILAPILMGAALLRGTASTDPERHLTEMIERNAERGADVVRQLLALSRGAPPDRRTLRPGALIEEIVRLVRATFPPRIVLRVEIAPDLCDVDADATQLHQVLLNLCVNARDAMPGSGTLSISAANVVVKHEDQPPGELMPGHYVAIAVADTGCGISEDARAHIFEPFFTTKAPGEGTGLGLSTVAGIVRNHGGTVTIDSTVGQGSTFRVFLPALLAPSEPTRTEPPPPPTGSGELILVVDDEPGVRSVLCALLERAGYQTIAAGDGEEAMRIFLLRRDEIRLVLSDLAMPVMDGLTLIRALRGLEPALPIVAAAGALDAVTQQELTSLAVNEILAKPYRPPELFGALRRELESVSPE